MLPRALPFVAIFLLAPCNWARAADNCITPASTQDSSSSNPSTTTQANSSASGALTEQTSNQSTIEWDTGFIDFIEPQSITITSSVTSSMPISPSGTSTPGGHPSGAKTLAELAIWNRQRAKELRENAPKYREEAKDTTKSEEFRKSMENLANECEKSADSLEAQADRLEADKPPEAGSGPFPEASSSPK